jgi:hypothetical protein
MAREECFSDTPMFDETAARYPVSEWTPAPEPEPWGLVPAEVERITAALRPSPRHAIRADSTLIIHRADAKPVGGEPR